MSHDLSASSVLSVEAGTLGRDARQGSRVVGGRRPPVSESGWL